MRGPITVEFLQPGVNDRDDVEVVTTYILRRRRRGPCRYNESSKGEEASKRKKRNDEAQLKGLDSYFLNFDGREDQSEAGRGGHATRGIAQTEDSEPHHLQVPKPRRRTSQAWCQGSTSSKDPSCIAQPSCPGDGFGGAGTQHSALHPPPSLRSCAANDIWSCGL